MAEVRSDGLENMIGALIVAGSLDIPEVTILFNNRLMRGNRSVKIDNFGLDAFNSPNMAPLATMDITINGIAFSGGGGEREREREENRGRRFKVKFLIDLLIKLYVTPARWWVQNFCFM